MTDTFSGVVTSDGRKRVFLTDDTLTKVGVPADAKTVGDKFAEAEETVSELNQALDDKTSQLKEDMDNLNDKKITKFYASNLGETHIADSDDGKIADMMLYGRSEQKQYSGRNLMPIFDDFETTVSGVSIKAKNGLITLEGNSIVTIGYSIPLKETITLPDKNIYIHLRNNAELTGSSLVFKNENGQVDFASISSINRVLVAHPLTGQSISEIMLSLGEGIAFKDFKMQPSLELTDEATSYEPYTGGQPSPSPDYPQEIKSVVNPTVKVCGKNLWSGKNTENYWNGNNEIVNTECISSDYIPIKGSQTIYTGFSYDWFVGFNCYDSKKNKILGSEQQINSTQENIEKEYEIVPSNIKTPENTAFIKIMFSKHESKPYVSIVEGEYEPYHEQTVALPYTLNAIPVSSGGNVAIDGQQYIADYVDVERGKLVRCVKKKTITASGAAYESEYNRFRFNSISDNIKEETKEVCTHFIYSNLTHETDLTCKFSPFISYIAMHSFGDNVDKFIEYINSNNVQVVFALDTSVETDLTPEEVQAFKALATYYPVTNISVNSEQLDGYTVFNYPISMENGWNYVKQQIGDTRDYIYDMDTKTQDIDTQSAEAYVNSEYAVALTELEV